MAVSYPTWKWVVLFLLLDAIALIFWFAKLEGLLESRFFVLGRDRGLQELIAYGKQLLGVLAFWALWQASHAPVIRAWAGLFLLMLLDNAIGLHEELGGLLAQWFTLPLMGLERAKDSGELIVTFLMYVPAFSYLAWCIAREAKAWLGFNLSLLWPTLLIGGFTLLLDTLHAPFEPYWELVALTALVALVHYRCRARIASLIHGTGDHKPVLAA